MEVRRKEGVTDHLHPESCAGRCEAAGEALTGARTGGAIEHRKQEFWSAETCHRGRRPHRHHRDGRGDEGLHGVEEPKHVRTSFAGTWEVFIPPRQSNRGRRGKEIPKPMMHGMKKSDGCGSSSSTAARVSASDMTRPT